MPTINPELRTAIGRKRGELNLNLSQLAKETGVSIWTLSPILSGKRTNVNRTTIEKLDNWLYQHI